MIAMKLRRFGSLTSEHKEMKMKATRIGPKRSIIVRTWPVEWSGIYVLFGCAKVENITTWRGERE
jgi:hypothetical protein